MLLIILFLISAYCSTVYSGLKEDHLVTNLPGLNFKTNFKYYSGYVQISDTQKLSYWLMESLNDTALDPLLICYAGCYVPHFADAVLKDKDVTLKLKGIAMGNAVTELNWLFTFQIPLQAYHGLVGMEELAEWENKYCPTGYENFCGEQISHAPKKWLERDFNNYNLAGKCYSGETCEGDSMRRYFNTPEVQESLHFDAKEWIYCNHEVHKHFAFCEDAETLVRSLLDNNVKVLYFYGTDDNVCPFIDGDLFTRKIGGVGKKDHWFVDNVYSGTQTVYPRNLIYTTVIGAGHPVATSKPKQMQNILSKFINDTEDWNA